ncbi:MAG: KpsF/GutQ family sugar-phosphate isomerase [Desulforhabdus sp.]|jgi:arabinose-5-phosphate isomerase|nr:KpsF/GutQ family sugar-phosphate isomerase [Desulforhabdus sp.]
MKGVRLDGQRAELELADTRYPDSEEAPFAPVKSERSTPDTGEILRIAQEVLKIEAEGILHLLDRLDESFATAVQWIYQASGRIIVTGIGKSGVIGRKIVATLSSTGTPALFMHPVEAMHGDLGMVRKEDLVLALSNSGETEELNIIFPSLQNIGTKTIALTGNLHSTLARFCDLAIYTGVPREACPFGLAPTASTTALLAMGDALAVALIKLRNFQAQDFRRYHPGGHLGERLKIAIRELMRRGDEIPFVMEHIHVCEALKEMNLKGMGATLILAQGKKLVGIFTDGDLRRAMNKFVDFSDRKIRDVMTPNPRTVTPDRSVAEALEIMEQHLITVLPVIDKEGGLQGILHLHDLLGKGMIQFTR